MNAKQSVAGEHRHPELGFPGFVKFGKATEVFLMT